MRSACPWFQDRSARTFAKLEKAGTVTNVLLQTNDGFFLAPGLWAGSIHECLRAAAQGLGKQSWRLSVRSVLVTICSRGAYGHTNYFPDPHLVPGIAAAVPRFVPDMPLRDIERTK